jgi:hypothetical protein
VKLGFGSADQVILTFSTKPLIIGNNTYTIAYTLPSSITINSPAGSNGQTITELTGTIVDPPDVAPEPSTLAMALSGLVVCGMRGVRHVRKARAVSFVLGLWTAKTR